MKQNRNGMKQNGDGTFSHDPYPLITERNTFKRTETDARQLLENESLSALSTLRNTLEKVQASDRKKALEKSKREAEHTLNEKKEKEEKIATLKKTIQDQEVKSRVDIQRQLNTALSTLNGALTTSYQSALTSQEARIKKEALSLERKKIAAQNTFLLAETAARQKIENDSEITVIQKMILATQKQKASLTKKQNQVALSALNSEEKNTRDEIAQEILAERDTWEKSKEFLIMQKRFSIQLGIFRHDNQTRHFNWPLYNRMEGYQSFYEKQKEQVLLTLQSLNQVTILNATADCEAFFTILLKTLTDLNDATLNVIALAFAHNYTHFTAEKFSQVKRQLRNSPCPESEIEDAPIIINDCIRTLEFFLNTLKELHPKDSCPVFDQKLPSGSPASDLVKLSFDLYSYVSIKLYQAQKQSAQITPYIQMAQHFELSCNKVFSCLAQLVLRSRKNQCPPAVLKADEKLYTELKAHVETMKNAWCNFSLQNSGDPNIDKNWSKFLDDVSNNLFEPEKKRLVLRR